MNRSMYLLPTAIAAILALAACDSRNDSTTGQRSDEAVAGARSGAESAQRAASGAATSVAKTAADMTITTKINAALAADDKLKATRIDVDTTEGRVVLTGTAPDSGSLERATTLARAVEGVLAVENRLRVESKG